MQNTFKMTEPSESKSLTLELFRVLKFLFLGLLFYILIVFYKAIFHPASIGEFNQEDMGYSIDQLVTRHGYFFENYTVITEDGYILELHRITSAKPSNNSNLPALILQHGLLGSSAALLANSANLSLPYYLADNGYDVWLPNSRGNYYSRKHQTLDPDVDPGKFFAYSWHEIGYYDLPAVIDFVTETTGQEKVFYSGHSQGSVALFVLLSERPEYNDKIRLMIGLAPVVYCKDVRLLGFVLAAKFQNTYEWITNTLGFHELMKQTELQTQISNQVCSSIPQLCSGLLGLNGGFNPEQQNKTLLPFILSHMPAGSSAKQLIHYAQIYNSDIFRQYDHGQDLNLLKYGHETPPKYNLRNTKVPVAIFYGKNDYATTEETIEKLVKSLPNVILKHRVLDELFNHFDFYLSMNAKDVLYPHILDVLSKY